MPADTELLFGKIAVARQFCTEQQVATCLQIQALSAVPKPLGQILIDNGFITPAQNGRLIEIQKSRMTSEDPIAKKQKAASLFGKLALQKKLLTEVELNQCLRLQAVDGETRSLGEIMVAKKFLTSKQVSDLLAEQQKKIMSCAMCQLSFTVLTQSKQGAALCPKCGAPLAEGKPSDSTRTDGEFATNITVAVEKDAFSGKALDPNATSVVHAKCKICGTMIDGRADSTGRVHCPHCRTRFVVKGNPRP